MNSSDTELNYWTHTRPIDMLVTSLFGRVPLHQVNWIQVNPRVMVYKRRLAIRARRVLKYQAYPLFIPVPSCSRSGEIDSIQILG